VLKESRRGKERPTNCGGSPPIGAICKSPDGTTWLNYRQVPLGSLLAHFVDSKVEGRELEKEKEVEKKEDSHREEFCPHIKGRIKTGFYGIGEQKMELKEFFYIKRGVLHC